MRGPLSLIGCVVMAATAIAHPGHDHGAEADFLAPKSVAPKPPTDFGTAAVGVAVLVATAALAAGLRAPRNLPAAVPLLGGIFAFAPAGCDPVAGAAGDEKHPHPPHRVRDLETLFSAFQKDGIKVRADDNYFYIESDAMPKHPMMVGITAWQQQVPLPQPYSGTNAWRIPLAPRVAAKPVPLKNNLLRGAVAIAVNGVPIFNPLNNRGDDAFLAGELDEYGGHCGRGDDYHYHVAPLHLEKTVGAGKPIAYALDGFPIYGLTAADGTAPNDLDECHGRFEPDGTYRYYSSKEYPYIQGAMKGVVAVRGGQIDPQPKDSPVRPAGEPLRGAKITAFTRDDENKTYTLNYTRGGARYSVAYSGPDGGPFKFVYTDGKGTETTETYRRRERK